MMTIQTTGNRVRLVIKTDKRKPRNEKNLIKYRRATLFQLKLYISYVSIKKDVNLTEYFTT